MTFNILDVIAVVGFEPETTVPSQFAQDVAVPPPVVYVFWAS